MFKNFFYSFICFYSFYYIGKFINLNNENLFSFAMLGFFYNTIKNNLIK